MTHCMIPAIRQANSVILSITVKGNVFLLYSNKIKSRQPAVTCVVAGMERTLLDNGIEEELTSEICLVVAEALNNVVEHAYKYAEDGDIEIDVLLEKSMLTIEINDFGPAFDLPAVSGPTEINEQQLENLPEGGFGWKLILMLMDVVSLKRRDNRNYLTLRKKIVTASC